MDITFPTTAEAFIAYQENGAGRKLNGLERDVLTEIAELINISYQEGVDGRAHTVSLKDVETFIPEQCQEDESPKLARILEIICWWCDRAYMAGKETQE